MTITFASLFTGGGGADLGAIAAGLKPIWGIEKDHAIAWYGGENTRFYKSDHKVLISDVCNADFSLLESSDWLHASPPCVCASTANNGKESPEDVGLLQSVYRAIEILQPKYFSLENVPGYKDFHCFRVLVHNLGCLGYKWSWRVLDASNFGVPQSRKRLFLIASKKNDCTYFFDRFNNLKSSIGWYEAIADVIPSLPECDLKQSQWQRLKNEFPELAESSLDFLHRPNQQGVILPFPDLAIQNSGSRKDKNGNPTNTIRLANEPIWTLRAMSGNVRPNPHQVTLIVNGKVLRPTIQCYARWQTFPDSYQWSDDFKVNVKICGNAVPPLMMKQIVEAVIYD